MHRVAIEPRIACAVDLAQACGPERAEDFIEGEGLTGAKRHGTRASGLQFVITLTRLPSGGFGCLIT